MISDENWKKIDDAKKTADEYKMWGVGKLLRHAQPWLNSVPVVGKCYSIDEVCDGLYISDFASACYEDKLKEQGITHIVTLMPGVGEMYPKSFVYLPIDICDRTYVDIKTYFNNASEFIDKAIKKGGKDGKPGKVLVHCHYGVSRSATICAAYLISKLNMTCEKSIELLKSKRDIVKPNDEFVKQLLTYENDIAKLKEKKEE